MKHLTGLDKVAVLVKSLGPKAAEAVLAQLGPEQSTRVRARMQQLDAAPESQQALDDVLREIARVLPNAAAAPKPTVNIVVAEEPAVEAPEEEPELPSDPLEALPQLAPERIASALAGESPRTVSLVLHLLETARAGEVYKGLTPELRREVSLQFASQPMPPLAVLRRIAQGIVQKTQALREAPPMPGAGDRIKKMAEFIRLLDRTERTELLATLDSKDAPTAQKIKDLLYVFDDLLQIENLSLQKMLAELDTKTLATALKGATPAIQHKFLTNLSKRAQDALQDEIDLMGNVPKARIEQARQGIADVIRRLDERGELVMVE
jgi:flagellar motor switch protein FliG